MRAAKAIVRNCIVVKPDIFKMAELIERETLCGEMRTMIERLQWQQLETPLGATAGCSECFGDPIEGHALSCSIGTLLARLEKET